MWFDRLWALTHPERDSAEGEIEGLVLSGGGSRASFHIGALRYLYDVCHISPTSIVATSAGAIVGSMLAQSLDAEEQSRALRVLEEGWLAMSDPAELFAEQAWFTKLRAHWGEIEAAIPEVLETEPSFVDPQEWDAEDVVWEALHSDPSTQDNDFSLSMLWQFLGSLGRIGKVGAGLASTLRGAERAASAYRPGPVVRKLMFESGFSTAAVKSSGVLLRLAIVGLKSGDLFYMREDGVIVDVDDHEVPGSCYDLSLGIWASCAIPGVFRPVKLGEELYVDGGVRENVPVEMAVTKLGVTKPYVIACSPPGVAIGDIEPRDLVSIMMRSFSILLDEVIQDEVSWARHAGATVIQPAISVHGPMDVDTGLLRINRDYGWMRAAEEVTGVESGSCDPIVRARMDLRLACGTGDVGAIGRARGALRTLLSSTDPALLPPGSEGWPEETWLP